MGHLSKEMNVVIVNSILAFLENKTFQQFFKFEVEPYCVFVSELFTNVNDVEHISKLLRSEHLFSKNIIHDEKFAKYFIKYNLSVLANVLSRFQDDEVVRMTCVLLQKVSFLNHIF